MLKDSFYQELISREGLTRKEYIQQVYSDSYDQVFSYVSEKVKDLEHITEQDIVDEINMYMTVFLSKHFGDDTMYQRYGIVIFDIERVIIDHLKILDKNKKENISTISYNTITDNQSSVSQDEINIKNMISTLTDVLNKKSKGKKGKLSAQQRVVILERCGFLDGDEKCFADIARKYHLTRSNMSSLFNNGIKNIRKELNIISDEI